MRSFLLVRTILCSRTTVFLSPFGSLDIPGRVGKRVLHIPPSGDQARGIGRIDK